MAELREPLIEFVDMSMGGYYASPAEPLRNRDRDMRVFENRSKVENFIRKTFEKS